MQKLMQKLKVIANGILMLMPLWNQLSQAHHNDDVAKTIIIGFCCLIKLIAFVKDFK